MQKLQLPFKGVGLGLLYGPLHVRLGDGVPAADGGEAVAGDAFEVGATHAHHHPLHLDPGHPFRLEEALADGLRGPFQVDHHPAPQPLGGDGALADDVQNAVRGELPDDGGDLGGAYVQASDDHGR